MTHYGQRVGSESSFRKLSDLLQCDVATIERYIRLLEQAFIIFRLPSYHRNLRTELKRNKKIFFFDNGIRNAIIGDFRALGLRTDVGALWENFLVSERYKYNAYRRFYGRSYFWRTTAQQELDYLEEVDGQLHAFEFKWNSGKKARPSRAFTRAYPDATFQVIHPDNYQSFLRTE
ncbi:MAG: DUF4143 domain-containing protein [Bacteroidota bacterium]